VNKLESIFFYVPTFYCELLVLGSKWCVATLITEEFISPLGLVVWFRGSVDAWVRSC